MIAPSLQYNKKGVSKWQNVTNADTIASASADARTMERTRGTPNPHPMTAVTTGASSPIKKDAAATANISAQMTSVVSRTEIHTICGTNVASANILRHKLPLPASAGSFFIPPCRALSKNARGAYAEIERQRSIITGAAPRPTPERQVFYENEHK